MARLSACLTRYPAVVVKWPPR